MAFKFKCLLKKGVWNLQVSVSSLYFNFYDLILLTCFSFFLFVREALGEVRLVDTAADPLTPKVRNAIIFSITFNT